jgi:hypothetical protein
LENAVVGQVNAFLWKGDHDDEHWQRHAMGYSLPRMLNVFRNEFTAEVIYEYYGRKPFSMHLRRWWLSNEEATPLAGAATGWCVRHGLDPVLYCHVLYCTVL